MGWCWMAGWWCSAIRWSRGSPVWCCRCRWASPAWAATPLQRTTACAVTPAVRMPMTKGTTEGFTLVELLLAAALGLMLCGVMAKLLIGEAALSGSLARRIEQKRLQQRTLALIKGDLTGADRWHLDPFTAPLAPCPMAGRRPILSIV